MSTHQIQTAVTAKVWQAIAQSGIDTSTMARDDLNILVELVVDAALEAADSELGQINQLQSSQATIQSEMPEGEVVLWEGRPLLSLTLHYTITSERIKISEGFLGKEWSDIELVRVQAMDYKQSLTERALNVGDILITTHDPNHPQVRLENIQNPKDVHEILREAVLEAREKYRLNYRENM